MLTADTPAARLTGVDSHERHFLRIMANDRPGVLAQITGILGDHGISIASVIQHVGGDGAADGVSSGAATETVPLVIMTHACSPAAIVRATTAIDASDVVAGRSICLPVLEE